MRRPFSHEQALTEPALQSCDLADDHALREVTFGLRPRHSCLCRLRPRYVVFALALLLVYFVLAGQYESWLAPLAVLFAVPLALIGPALALGAVGLANNLYTQIGMVLLIALSAKNAVLIVEVAREEQASGMDAATAAVHAARARFRPILMTSFAFILGIVPLVLSTGAGAAARISLGLAVLSGMLASTCLAVLFVPSIYVMLEHGAERFKRRAPAALQNSPNLEPK